jgi:hypothetical protein
VRTVVDHDVLCRNLNWTPWTEGARCPVCDEYARVRAHEQARLNAQAQGMLRMLLDSGDITPLGARMITKVLETKGDAQ